MRGAVLVVMVHDLLKAYEGGQESDTSETFWLKIPALAW